MHHDLWGDMCAENDAEHLWTHLSQLNIDFSPEFREALKEWRADEQNHYIGLRQICSTMYSVSEEEIDQQMKQRIADYKNIENFLVDEFKICVVLAYDELVSARGYTIFAEDFRKFGPEEYLKWVRRAARDEALHYQNFIDIAKFLHTHRLPEATAIINEISAYENRDDYTYKATFLLDHTDQTFKREFLLECGEMVLAALIRS